MLMMRLFSASPWQHLCRIWLSSVWGWKPGLAPPLISWAWLLFEGWLQSVLEKEEHFL